MELALGCTYRTKPSSLLNSLFTSTVDSAARMLVEVASDVKSNGGERWSASDHLRFMVMLITWFSLWFLRILMDYLPSPFTDSLPYAALPYSFHPSSSMDINVILHEGLNTSSTASMEALGRGLFHILKMINEIPASSRKYQFAVTMADKIIDENTKAGYAELMELNRGALASAFERTSSLLYHALRSKAENFQEGVSFTRRLFQAVPLGSYLSAYFKGISFFLNLVFPSASKPAVTSGDYDDELVAEKHAQELLWITGKLKSCGAVDEALVQWSLASRLASVSLVANPRVQGIILRITVTLFREVAGAEWEVGNDLKFRMMGLWIPLFCYAGNGLAYPVLSGYEKLDMERIMDDVVSSLPASYQEIILTNWLQDFTMSASDWPNLQHSYDRWCRSSRGLLEWTS